LPPSNVRGVCMPMNQYRCETCTKQGCHYHPNNNYWKDLSNGLLHFFYDSIDNVGCASHSDFQSERETLHLSSSDLLLIAHDEWKRREERKHQHDHISWVNGWISGFLTSRKFVQEKIVELRQQAGEP
jgi:hypothetical protein